MHSLQPVTVTLAVLVTILTIRPASAADFAWSIRYVESADRFFDATTAADGLTFQTRSVGIDAPDLYVSYLLKLDRPLKAIEFDYALTGDASKMPVTLHDAAANVLWRYDGQGEPPAHVKIEPISARGQLIFRVRRDRSAELSEGWSHRIANIKVTDDAREPTHAADGSILIDSLDELRGYASQDSVKVRLKPGTYKLDKALFRSFIEFSGNDSRFDFKDVKLQVDTGLFSQFGVAGGAGGIYCALTLSGDRIEMNDLTVETIGDRPGIQSRNKIFNIVGRNVTLRNADITTQGSAPWGYGSLFGIGGGIVRKMNGIRVGSPAQDVKLIGCRMHMRAMGHAIFIQGAQNTLVQDCHVDGLLRPTNEILAEKSGVAFERDFVMVGNFEGVGKTAEGKIPPDEMVSLSEDGIRMYANSGAATIIDCTVTRMRRGICVGLSDGADRVINCEVRDCIATGFNVGSNDVLENCRADAKHAEALCLPYSNASNAQIDLQILDTRGGMANDMIAKINGSGHRVILKTASPEFIPKGMMIELATSKGYGASREGAARAANITLDNRTPAPVVLNANVSDCNVRSDGPVVDKRSAPTKRTSP